MDSVQSQDTERLDKQSRIRFTLGVVLSCGTALAAGAALYCLIAEVLTCVQDKAAVNSGRQVRTHKRCSRLLSSAGKKASACK